MGRKGEKSNPAISSPQNSSIFGLSDSIRYTKYLFRILGIWSLVIPNPSKFERKLAIFIRILAIFSMSIVLVPLYAELIAYRIDSAALMSLVTPLTYQSFNSMKFFCLIFRKNNVKDCMKHMKDDWEKMETLEEREIMIRNMKIAKKLALIVTSAIYAGCTTYHFILPMLEHSYVNEFNETIKPLVNPGGDLLFDVQAPVIYQIVFFAYYVSALSIVTVAMGCFNLALILVYHACGQTQVIISRLEKLDKLDKDDGILKGQIAIIIHGHSRLFSFCSYIKKVLNEICLTEIICQTLLMCFLAYTWISELENSDAVTVFSYTSMLGSLCFNLFLYCQIGETLKEQCEEVGKAAYMIDWYNLPVKTSLHLIVIIFISARPIQLSAGGMMDVSRITFGEIIKTSFVYLNMLRTME